MSGINIKEKLVVNFYADNGVEFHPGDTLILRADGRDVICKFKAVENGYFKTTTLDGKSEVKYRISSIKSSAVVEELAIKGKYKKSEFIVEESDKEEENDGEERTDSGE